MAVMRDPRYWRRFAYAQVAFVLLLAVGTVGFQLLLGQGWVESFYRAVVSTTLTGLDSAPETNAGKIFTVVLLFAGVAVFFYIAGVIVDVITRGVLSDVLGERRRKRAIEDLQDHVIICGYGRVGRSVAAVVARASNESAARKIRLAGANRVVQPYSHAGLHLANLVVKPQVADFLDIVTTAGGPLPDLRFEEIVVTRECGKAVRSLADL